MHQGLLVTNADVAQRLAQDAYTIKVMGSSPFISTFILWGGVMAAFEAHNLLVQFDSGDRNQLFICVFRGMYNFQTFLRIRKYFIWRYGETAITRDSYPLIPISSIGSATKG